MLDPYTVFFWFVGQAPYLYVIYILYRDGAWPGDYKITIHWCGVLTFTCGKRSVYEHHLAQTIHRRILTRTAVSQTSWLQQNISWYRTRPQTVPLVKHKYVAAILKVLEPKGKQIISSSWGLHNWTHAVIEPCHCNYSRLRSVKTHQIYCQYVSWQLVLTYKVIIRPYWTTYSDAKLITTLY
jgi:hypothetical protein